MNPIYKPSHLQAFLEEWGLQAKKGLSQNFLIDGNIVQKILDAAEVDSTDFIIEIGPGPGALTQAILERGAQLLAIEMDPVFAEALKRFQTPDGRLEVVHADILKFPLLEFLRKRQGRKCKIVANLPYHITTPILTLLFPLSESIESLTIMVQKEFAQRMTAKKATPEYSSLTVFLQFYGSIPKSFIVKSSCFYPKPRVDSSVIHCKLHSPLLPGKEERFFQLTRAAFGQRRKMLRSSLRELYSPEKVEEALLKIGHPHTERPEGLSIDEFILLYEMLNVES